MFYRILIMSKLTASVKFIMIISLIGWIEHANLEDGDPNNAENDFQRAVVKSFQYSKFAIESIAKSSEMLISLIHRDSLASSMRKSNKHNFASSSSGAKVISSVGIHKASKVLSKDKDTYLSFSCDQSLVKASMIISLEEDAFVEIVKFRFFESYNNFVKDFEVFLSINGASDSWIPAGIYTTKNHEANQEFKLLEPRLARHLKINFLSAYSSFNHYCTITQIEVYGKTYLTYTTEKTAKRLNEEFQKSLDDKKKQQEERKLEYKRVSILENDDGNENSLVLDIKSELIKAVDYRNHRIRQKEALMAKAMCPVFQDLYLTAKNQCALSDRLVKLISDEGPLESYYEMLSSKINVSTAPLIP